MFHEFDSLYYVDFSIMETNSQNNIWKCHFFEFKYVQCGVFYVVYFKRGGEGSWNINHFVYTLHRNKNDVKRKIDNFSTFILAFNTENNLFLIFIYYFFCALSKGKTYLVSRAFTVVYFIHKTIYIQCQNL